MADRQGMHFGLSSVAVRRMSLALPPARLPPSVLLSQIAAAVGLVVLTLSILLRAHPGVEPIFDSWLYDGLDLWCAAIVAMRGWRVATERAAWWTLSVGMGLSALGDVVYSALVSGPHAEVYSIADPLYLAFYPCAYVGLVLLLKGKIVGFRPSAWLDGAICALAVSAVAAAVAFGPISADTGGSAVAVAVGLAYPLCDLLLLALSVAMLTWLGWRAERRLILLAFSFVLFWAADTLFLFQAARGTYVEGTWVDLLWPASSLLVARASWRPTRRLASGRSNAGVALMPTLVCALLALGVLVVAARYSVPQLAVALAVATMVAGLVRLAWTVREVTTSLSSRALALTDDLTGLGNRSALLAALRQIARAPEPCAAMLLIDVDRSKQSDDAHGTQAGDECLRQLAQRLARTTRPGDLLTRVGGDEFAVLLAVGDLPAAQLAAECIQAALDQPFALDDLTVHVAASIGIAMSPADCADPMHLLQRANVAMSSAKTDHTRVASYRSANDPHSRDQLKIVEDLRAALTHGKLTVYYQPKITVATGRVDSVEALVRWQHPLHGLLSPDVFVPLAEQNGLMRPLTLAVLTQSLAQLHQWREHGLHLTVAVNLSATNLLDAELVSDIGRLLAQHRLAPHTLTLEITETVLMIDPVRATAMLQALRELGVGLSIDDYGTGYSSLAYLRDLSVDELKLDRMFITNMLNDDRCAAIVASTIDLAHHLGMRIVAEGVEDADTLVALTRYGCDISQGYYHSQPLPAAGLKDLLSLGVNQPADIGDSLTV